MSAGRFSFVAVLLLAATAHAAVPDPKILIAGSGYSEPVYNLEFMFAANATGGGTYDFYNASGVDWIELNIVTGMPFGLVDDSWMPLDDPAYYDLSSDLFAHSALTFTADSLTLRFFGIDATHPGIRFTGSSPARDVRGTPWGSHFFVNLDDRGIGTPGVGGWFGANHDPLVFNSTATPVPEPRSLALLLGGVLVCCAGFRRRRPSARRQARTV